MGKENILLGVLLIAVIGVFGYALSGFFGIGSAETGSAGQNTDTGTGALPAEPQKFAAKTSEGEVSVDITPKKFEAGRFYFDISVNTHSVDLSGFDLKKIAVLEAGGKKFLPVSSPELSGHHNNGAVVFETREEFNSFAIKITGLADINERVFAWP